MKAKASDKGRRIDGSAAGGSMREIVLLIGEGYKQVARRVCFSITCYRPKRDLAIPVLIVGGMNFNVHSGAGSSGIGVVEILSGDIGIQSLSTRRVQVDSYLNLVLTYALRITDEHFNYQWVRMWGRRVRRCVSWFGRFR